MSSKEEQNITIGIIIAFVILILLVMAGSDDGSTYGPGCYDADPTQWVDVVCE